ncbi:hypothetical protein [Halobacillus sp. A5]|uniref:hypothetical protein n=1 Tax=Halobacillus sp. A5 TaxID=2880263 RepID=UPI0020A63D1E|nr:hypothetical protein [Halobacillus sp. A5]MCP3026879.1 hypothetical protein [Halobacillus sp. A5]
MKKENQMLIILSIIGTANVAAGIILLVIVQNLLVSALLIVSGALLIAGGMADKSEHKKRKGRS